MRQGVKGTLVPQGRNTAGREAVSFPLKLSLKTITLNGVKKVNARKRGVSRRENGHTPQPENKIKTETKVHTPYTLQAGWADMPR